MRRAAKVDANQPEIVEAFRKCGARVVLLHRVGGGVPDLLVARHGETFLVEIKDGSLAASGRRLNDVQIKFWADWPARIELVETVDDVLRIMGAK